MGIFVVVDEEGNRGVKKRADADVSVCGLRGGGGVVEGTGGGG